LLTIWGRPNSVNVQKVLWCLSELELTYERVDAGMQYGRNREADYLAMNPNGRIPTLVDGDYVLWESNSIMRYLCMAYGQPSPIYPQDAKGRAAVDRWLDWTLSTLQPVDRPVFWAISSRSRTSQLAPLHDAGSASKASSDRSCRSSTAGLRNLPTGRGSFSSSRPRCRDGNRPAHRQLKCRRARAAAQR
jgi:glutathione S-transferase